MVFKALKAQWLRSADAKGDRDRLERELREHKAGNRLECPLYKPLYRYLHMYYSISVLFFWVLFLLGLLFCFSSLRVASPGLFLDCCATVCLTVDDADGGS